MQNRLPISICMISGAEAQRIGRALESVVEWAGEVIVVLNADVNDGTDDIAARFGAKVFREPWKGHIAQKNSAAGKSCQPWLLGLDADEVVSPELREEITRLFILPAEAARFAAYSFPRCTFYCGRWIRHGDWYPDRQTRLWQKGRARWGGIDPHDRLEVSGPVAPLRQELLHYSMEDLPHQLAKIGAYSTTFARRRVEARRRPTMLDLTVRPTWRFFRCYCLRFGFLDGWVGFYLAWQTAFACLTRYARTLEMLDAPPSAPCPTSASSSSPATPAP